MMTENYRESSSSSGESLPDEELSLPSQQKSVDKRDYIDEVKEDD